MTEDITNIHYYRCPICFICWEDTASKDDSCREDYEENGTTPKECSHCHRRKMNLEELIDRQMFVMDTTLASDFPAIAKNLWKYIKRNKGE